MTECLILGITPLCTCLEPNLGKGHSEGSFMHLVQIGVSARPILLCTDGIVIKLQTFAVMTVYHHGSSHSWIPSQALRVSQSIARLLCDTLSPER